MPACVSASESPRGPNLAAHAARAQEAEADAAESTADAGGRIDRDTDRGDPPAVTLGHGGTSLRLAYADPPYPGRAELYRDHPDFAGEVDHARLIAQLGAYDGWALSTSASALRDVLPMCPAGVLVLAWTKHVLPYGWEPVIVKQARPAHGLRPWIQCEPDAFQWRPRPDTHVIGAKPAPFSRWVFEWLGARAGDRLTDLFPGSGAVARAWEEWNRQPQLDHDVQLSITEHELSAADLARPGPMTPAQLRRRSRRPPRAPLA